jgi:hypothetical protein
VTLVSLYSGWMPAFIGFERAALPRKKARSVATRVGSGKANDRSVALLCRNRVNCVAEVKNQVAASRRLSTKAVDKTVDALFPATLEMLQQCSTVKLLKI